MRILIIEDDKNLVFAIRKVLMAHFIVDAADNGYDGVFKAETCEYDLILLDLSLPDIDGYEVCREIRKSYPSLPILVITGRDGVEEKVKLLDSGADDYITKPFNTIELLARTRALLRRNKPIKDNVILLDGLELNIDSKEVSRDGVPLKLRRKEFDLLEYMIRNPNRILTRQMIMDHVWDMNETLWTNAIDVHVKHLRDKIDKPFDMKSIVTVHGLGYKFTPEKHAVK